MSKQKRRTKNAHDLHEHHFSGIDLMRMPHTELQSMPIDATKIFGSLLSSNRRRHCIEHTQANRLECHQKKRLLAMAVVPTPRNRRLAVTSIQYRIQFDAIRQKTKWLALRPFRTAPDKLRAYNYKLIVTILRSSQSLIRFAG